MSQAPQVPGLNSPSAAVPAEMLAALAGELPVALLCLDRNWFLTYANAEAIRISRLEPEMFSAKTHWELYPETVGTEVERRYRQAMEGGKADRFEYCYEPFRVYLDIHVLPIATGIALLYRDVTAQRLAEREAAEVAVRVQQVLDADPNGVVIVDPDWRFAFANRRAKEIVNDWDFVGHDIFERFPGNGEEPFNSTYRATMADRQPREFEAFHTEPIKLWLKVQVRPNEDGGIIIFFSDVTRRKAAEEREQDTQRRLSQVLEVTSDAIASLDREWRYTYLNANAQRLIDPENKLLGKNIWEEFPDAVGGPAWEIYHRSMNEGIPGRTEIYYPEPINAWLDIQSQPAADGIVVFFRDITEAKRLNEQLRVEQGETERQRTELETVYETAPIGLALFDPVEFRYLRLNERQAQILGLPKDQVLGRPVTDFAPIEGVRELFAQVARGQPVRNFLLEGELTMAPGEHRYWTVNYFPVYGPDGSVQAITAASLEITNQKKSEAALIQSEKLAAVGRLASSISHEINNPLEAITNLLYLIAMDGELPEHMKVLVHMAQSELGRVSQIATQTLRFHRQAVNPTQVTPEALVSAVIQLYTGRLANAHIKVDTRYAAKMKILCFENDIRQVLNNLIANAIDAMRMGGRLLVRAHESRDHEAGPGRGRHGVRITIADTGHGMSAATLRRLFEPFFTTKDLQGTGLGLWISAGIVERHQGRLRVRSSDDPRRHGTVFTLFLPCEEVRTL